MTTTRQQRSPMGALYRTPMGAFGPGEAPAPSELAIVRARSITERFTSDTIDWSILGAPTCRLTISFGGSPPGGVYSVFQTTGIEGSTPVPPNISPNHLELWDYTWIGDVTGDRFKLADFAAFVCWNDGGGVGTARSVGGAAEPSPAAGGDGGATVTETGVIEFRLISAPGTEATHPAWIADEGLTGYPTPLVPP